MNDARMLGPDTELLEAFLAILALEDSVIGKGIDGELSSVCLTAVSAKELCYPIYPVEDGRSVPSGKSK